jgi:hypothetical protein
MAHGPHTAEVLHKVSDLKNGREIRQSASGCGGIHMESPVINRSVAAHYYKRLRES